MLLRLSCGFGLLGMVAQGAEVRLSNHTFTVPDGFEIERVAGPPLIERPISMDFDEAGRLYVSDSSGSNDKVEKQLEEKPHRIVRLEDTDGDGKFDKSIVFADRMMFPEGAMWFDGSLYVTAPPSIWKLTDTDADGVADQRVEWFQAKTLTGCANDLHGPYLGPDGWFYWCKGAFAKQTYEQPGKSPFVTRAAHIFRSRSDGSGVEAVMTGGMDNPVDVAFTPGGERIFTTTFFQHPAGGKRDGLVHAVYGGVYGKVHDVIDEHPRTGDVMPVLTHMGPAAPCGLIRYESRVLGADYQDNLFACQFNLHKVSRHVLERSGATFRTRDEDFLVSDNPDFHPTDVLEDADGTLLVIDTGGWYKLCCPTSQLPKPDVLGAIYRIRRKGISPLKDARGLKIAKHDLFELLGDERPIVQRREMELLAKMQGKAVPALAHIIKTSKSVTARRNAVWTLTRITDPAAREAVRAALRDKDLTVQQAALHSCSLWRDKGAVAALMEILTSEADPQLRRVAAEALGRIGDRKAVSALLSAKAAKEDRFLEHSITYALIEIGNREETVPGLLASASRKRALIALDQMENGGLTAQQVIPLLNSSDRETAYWVVSHHPEWGPELAKHFRTALNQGNTSEVERALISLARNRAIQELVTDFATNAQPELRLMAFRVIRQSAVKEAPEEWIQVLTSSLVGNDAKLEKESIAALTALPINKRHQPQVSDALAKVAENNKVETGLRLEAAAAASIPVGDELLDFLCAHTGHEQPLPHRSMAAMAIAKAKLTPEQLLALAKRMGEFGPLELTKILGAFENSTNEALGLQLVGTLKGSRHLSSLHPDAFRSRMAKYPPTVQHEVQALVAVLNADALKQKAHLETLLGSVKDGDIRRGQSVFNSSKAACASCHAIGYLGGKLGPDLTRIGQVRTERDLLESVIYPSASFVRSYEPVIVATKSGDEHSGVLRKDAADEVIVATGPDTEVRIARSDVQELRPGTVSIMPQGLDQQLTQGEIADLLAFLRATRW